MCKRISIGIANSGLTECWSNNFQIALSEYIKYASLVLEINLYV